MNILMIGNGFDLYHGLKTKYSDFLNFVEQINGSSLDNIFTDEEIKLFKNNDSNNERTAFLCHLYQENIWYEYLKERYKANQSNMQNWIDFEREIEHVIILLEKYFTYKNGSKNEDKVIFDLYSRKFDYALNSKIYELCLEKKYFEISNLLKNGLDDFIQALSIYLEYYIENISMENTREESLIRSLISSFSDNDVHVLSFNYTHTYKEIYGLSKEQDICFIHGEARNSGKNMVLGIEEYLDDDEKNRQLMFVSYKKFFQRIVKGTSNVYVEWLKKSEDNYNFFRTKNIDYHNDLLVFGHSLDPTDGDIIRKMIDNEFTHTTVYYLDESDLESKVMNLIKVIGEDHLVDKTSNGLIKFMQIIK